MIEQIIKHVKNPGINILTTPFSAQFNATLSAGKFTFDQDQPFFQSAPPASFMSAYSIFLGIYSSRNRNVVLAIDINVGVIQKVCNRMPVLRHDQIRLATTPLFY